MTVMTSAAPVPSVGRLLGLLLAALVFVLLLAGIHRVAAADDTDNPGSKVSMLADAAIAVLVDPALDRDGRQQRFRVLLNDGFDLEAIGRFVLGRYWPSATDQERVQFRELFESFLITSYVSKLETYSGESLKVTATRKTEADRAMVSSRLELPTGEPIRVEWHMRQGDAGWQIVDVVIEGVSLAVTIRSEFTSVIRTRGGLAGLLERLRQVTANAG